jgi:16S rRNA (guanine966-N2)-methyltransferase
VSVKILGGVCKGFPLATPRSETRPTSVLIKRKLFDWRQNLEGFTFIDVCAGSGAMAFEALSRGAERVVVNDQDKSSLYTLKKNKEELMRAFGLDEKNIVVSGVDARKWVERELSYLQVDGEDTILFLDPPYAEHSLYRDVISLLKEKNYRGELWVESDRLSGIKLPEVTGLFHSVIKTVEQGDHFVVVGFLY